MTIESITSGQEKQIARFLEDAAISATKLGLAQVVLRLDKDSAQCIITRGDELKVAIEQATINALKQLSSRYLVLEETKLLKPVAIATVPARTKFFNAEMFYQTGPGLYVWGTFEDRLDLRARQIVSSAPERSYVASLLKANAYDRDIRKELPENHLSRLEDIAALIEAQPDGKSGILFTNGYTNIFYVEGKDGEVFAVGVRWGSDGRAWRVSAWRLDEVGDWLAGFPVLCPGNAVL